MHAVRKFAVRRRRCDAVPSGPLQPHGRPLSRKIGYKPSAPFLALVTDPDVSRFGDQLAVFFGAAPALRVQRLAVVADGEV